MEHIHIFRLFMNLSKNVFYKQNLFPWVFVPYIEDLRKSTSLWYCLYTRQFVLTKQAFSAPSP